MEADPEEEPMAVFKRPDAEIYYEVHGSGHPLLLFAPGGLRSQLDFWRQSPSNPDTPPPWMNPMVDLAGRFTVIGMDQRNAGKSRGAVQANHGWHTYASDHLALMDHLGHRRFHAMGGCIGASFCLTLCEMAPERVTAAVLQNPIGLHDNRDTWDEAVSGFAKTMLERDPSLSENVIRKFGQNMFGGDFVFSVSRDFVRRCPTPLLLQPGTDKPHPAHTSAEIAQLAPNLEVQQDWRGPTHLAESIRRVTDFLTRHTPSS
jgi:pimeloyl-ACP methyl ester carboxylesterase